MKDSYFNTETEASRRATTTWIIEQNIDQLAEVINKSNWARNLISSIPKLEVVFFLADTGHLCTHNAPQATMRCSALLTHKNQIRKIKSFSSAPTKNISSEELRETLSEIGKVSIENALKQTEGFPVLI